MTPMYSPRRSFGRRTVAPLVPQAVRDRIGAKAEAFAAVFQPPRTTPPDRLLGALEASVDLLSEPWSFDTSPAAQAAVAALQAPQEHHRGYANLQACRRRDPVLVPRTPATPQPPADPRAVDRIDALSHEQRHTLHGTESYQLDRAGDRYFVVRRADRQQAEVDRTEIEASLRCIYARVETNEWRERELESLLHAAWARARADAHRRTTREGGR